ncbi:MAG: PAS domain-containing sensor histidine kinase [Rhodospirillaceae bacterium]|nr:PAS domain-containing sensor histidine kinase [Rhodospirillaceae bacterium]
MMDAAAPRPAQDQRWLLRMAALVNHAALSRRLAIGLAIAALMFGILTYIILTESPLGANPGTNLTLVIVNLVIILPLAGLIAFRVVRLWAARRQGKAGSQLHARLVLLFSIIAVTPAIIVAVFSAVMFEFGIQSWFNVRVSTALRESLNITEKYIDEHIIAIREDLRNLGSDVNNYALELMNTPRRLPEFVSRRAQERGIMGASVFDDRGRILMSDAGNFSPSNEKPENLRAAMSRIQKDGDIVVIARRGEHNIRALMRLKIFFDSNVYLYISRPIEPTLRPHMVRMQDAVDEYLKLEGQRSSFQIGFFLLYAVVSLLLLLAAVWLGLYFANQLVRPISELISASERVAQGDLSVRLRRNRHDEISNLSLYFNRMTRDLQKNHEKLVEANRQVEARRAFTEKVLEGVTAGVIGLDADQQINLPNRSASELLQTDMETQLGKPVAEVIPEFADMIENIKRYPARHHRSEVVISREGRTRTLIVQLAAEQIGSEIVGYVFTFDDITDLQRAQRTAAWADVARRIAHEIKNPLTPIQLSAERLRRKYLKQITVEPEVFETCTATIIRQVDDIGRLVSEFSSFARMPAPRMKENDLRELCRQNMFLQKSAHPAITYEFDGGAAPLNVRCDEHQVGQALTNLLQNAANAIEEESWDTGAGTVSLAIRETDHKIVVSVTDTGSGLPKDMMHRLTEPYMTTRAKGTGLGLAIVRKIMEDHQGELRLQNNAGGDEPRGATVSMVFPASIRVNEHEQAAVSGA